MTNSHIGDPDTGVMKKPAESVIVARVWYFSLPAGVADAGATVLHRVVDTESYVAVQRIDKFGGWESVYSCRVLPNGDPDVFSTDKVALIGFARLLASRRAPDQVVELKP